MSAEDRPAASAAFHRGHAQEIELSGHSYVLMPKPDYQKLVAHADEGGANPAELLGSGPVGTHLRARRRAAGLTLVVAAARAGIAPETLSRIENNHTNPSVATVAGILKGLGNGAARTGVDPQPVDTDLVRAVQDAFAMRRAAAEAQSRLAAIVESSDDAIVSKTLDGIVTSWNDGARRLFGYSAEDIIGRSITLIIPQNRLGEEAEIIGKIRRGERVSHFETVRRRKDGSLVDISLSVSPVKDEDGRIVGASKIARDITTQKRIADEARKLNSVLEDRVRERTRSLQETIQELDSFAYTVAHDLRAPLRAVHSFGEILLEEVGPRLNDEERLYLQEMVRAGARMDLLISDLLNYSRISRQETPLERVDLDRVVDLALADLKKEFSDRGADVQVDGPLPTVNGQSVLVGQILTNLLTNAVKFTDRTKAPRVRIRAERAPSVLGKIRLWVEDNGIGIAEEHQKRLFKVFERLHGRDVYPGTGIGLAIVRRAAERMGGSAGVESEVGKGSRFWVDLAEGMP